MPTMTPYDETYDVRSLCEAASSVYMRVKTPQIV